MEMALRKLRHSLTQMLTAAKQLPSSLQNHKKNINCWERTWSNGNLMEQHICGEEKSLKLISWIRFVVIYMLTNRGRCQTNKINFPLLTRFWSKLSSFQSLATKIRNCCARELIAQSWTFVAQKYCTASITLVFIPGLAISYFDRLIWVIWVLYMLKRFHAPKHY